MNNISFSIIPFLFSIALQLISPLKRLPKKETLKELAGENLSDDIFVYMEYLAGTDITLSSIYLSIVGLLTIALETNILLGVVIVFPLLICLYLANLAFDRLDPYTYLRKTPFKIKRRNKVLVSYTWDSVIIIALNIIMIVGTYVSSTNP
ncbi:MAG: hypothetical protein H3Z54_09335 [archaeon]|nr:hypothetical protein [archaeon]